MINEGEPQDQIREREQLVSSLRRLNQMTRPEDWGFQNIDRAQNLLIRLFTDIEDIKHIARTTGMGEAQIAWDAKPINCWFVVLTEANYTVGINNVISVALKYLEDLQTIDAIKLENLLTLLDQPDQYDIKRGRLLELVADLLESGAINPSYNALNQFVRDSLSQS